MSEEEEASEDEDEEPESDLMKRIKAQQKADIARLEKEQENGEGDDQAEPEAQ